MAAPYEIQRSQTNRAKYNSPDMIDIRTRSFVSGQNYTCCVCGQALVGLETFRRHAMDAHEVRNKEPYMGRR